MKDVHLEEIKTLIESTIVKTVNGKITALDNKVTKYIEQDNEWKKQAEPVIKMGENVQGFGKVSLYIVGFVASVAGAILVIINLFKNK